MTAFLAVSVVLHAAVLLAWQPQIEWPLAGQQRINVVLSPLPPADAARPSQAAQNPAAMPPAHQPRPPVRRTARNTAAAPIVRNPATATDHSAAAPESRPTPAHHSPATAAATADQSAPVRSSLLARQNITVYLHRVVSANFQYPYLARRHGWQGEVRLAMHIEPDGRLSNLRVQRTSGHRILDLAALRTLQAIDVIPGAVNWLQGHALDIVLPVDYRLLDS